MKRIIKLTERDLTRIVKKILISENPNPQVQTQNPQVQEPISNVNFKPQHKGMFEVDCQSGLIRLTGYPGKFSKEGNSLIKDVFCLPKYRAKL